MRLDRAGGRSRGGQPHRDAEASLGARGDVEPTVVQEVHGQLSRQLECASERGASRESRVARASAPPAGATEPCAQLRMCRTGFSGGAVHLWMNQNLPGSSALWTATESGARRFSPRPRASLRTSSTAAHGISRDNAGATVKLVCSEDGIGHATSSPAGTRTPPGRPQRGAASRDRGADALSRSPPTGTRTQTVPILSRLPLPIGLWGACLSPSEASLHACRTAARARGVLAQDRPGLLPRSPRASLRARPELRAYQGWGSASGAQE